MENRQVYEQRGKISAYILEISTKDFRIIKLFFDNSDEINLVTNTIESLIFPEDPILQNLGLSNLFLATHFKKVKHLNPSSSGWNLYKDPLKEFYRQGVELEKDFRVYTNSHYDTCPSYPKVHIIP